jgi:hypothetical protein
VDHKIDSEEREEVLFSFQPIYEKFLIGTRMMEKVVVSTLEKLQTLAQVAQDYPNSLQQLREVETGHVFWYSLKTNLNFRDVCFKVKTSAPSLYD